MMLMAVAYWWLVGYGATVVFVPPSLTWTGTVFQGCAGMVLTLAVIFSLAVLWQPGEFRLAQADSWLSARQGSVGR